MFILIILFTFILLFGCEGPVGPEGPPGDKGEQGPKGESGEAMEQTFNIDVASLNPDSITTTYDTTKSGEVSARYEYYSFEKEPEFIEGSGLIHYYVHPWDFLKQRRIDSIWVKLQSTSHHDVDIVGRIAGIGFIKNALSGNVHPTKPHNIQPLPQGLTYAKMYYRSKSTGDDIPASYFDEANGLYTAAVQKTNKISVYFRYKTAWLAFNLNQGEAPPEPSGLPTLKSVGFKPFEVRVVFIPTRSVNTKVNYSIYNDVASYHGLAK